MTVESCRTRAMASANALMAIEEGGRSRDQQIQTRESTGVNFIDQLTQCIKALVANVATHSLNCFDFVKDNK